MKILVVRFSSIGDVVLTTPVLRALKSQLKDVEIHYLTKSVFRSVIDSNPNISKVITIEKSIDEVVDVLKTEQYDWIIDLHNNIRTKSLKNKLRRPSKAFRKLNIKKWLLVNFKINRLPKIHIVERYFEAVAHLGVQPDGKPGDFFIETKNQVDVATLGLTPKNYVALAIGAQFATKQLPVSKLIEIIEKIESPVVLIGGPTDIDSANAIVAQLSKKCVNTCGQLNIQQSASVVAQSRHLITHDTGMMHIASCLDVPMTTVWGNTVPSFGMFPYVPNKPDSFTIHEVQNLACRPCSKIGHKECPKKHFNCMMDQDAAAIAAGL